MIEIVEVDTSSNSPYNDALRRFEGLFQYPLGDDRFIIDHGADYFAFFRRIGQPYFFAAIEDGKIVALAGAVLRTLDELGGLNLEPVWYICDRKVHPNYQGQQLVQRLLVFAFKKYARISRSAYAVSMNTSVGENRVARFAERMPLLNLKPVETLHFFLLDQAQANHMNAAFRRVFPNRRYVSLLGVKDLVLSSTQQPLRFSHFAKLEDSVSETEGERYMVCLPASHHLNQDLISVCGKPLASATVLSNIEHVDWSLITSDEI